MIGNSRCVKQIRLEQKRNDETIEIANIFRRQLKALGEEPFKVTNRFGDCSSATYSLKIEVTDDQLKKYEIITDLNPLKMLNLFDEEKAVKTVPTSSGFSVFWKEGGMFSRSPLLLNCISGAEIYHKGKGLQKIIDTGKEQARVPPTDLSICESYEVRYHFFTQQP